MVIIVKIYVKIVEVIGIEFVGWYMCFVVLLYICVLLKVYGGFFYDSDVYDDDIFCMDGFYVVLFYVFDINDMCFLFGGVFV